ncbi:TcpE family conjugal transfer membrane protein [Actinomadura sp. K4S16]|uniref:TcpE family conjugal transfer membrane protein n=1 Tax=Actinomadura sp. K4S16 TaxID=1316147 RepID=UPI0011ED4639|nr:TcpE family conjugal transfer membrane protein [Actinomadura sp. K4S16]
MDLPTYTNIWRIEKRLYKLYDLRLPMPLPLVQIGVFLGVFVPWIVLLRVVGIPFESPWHVLYIVPPGVLTWMATRPVIEGKRLTELLLSQGRYLAEPRTWCRLTPIQEPREVVIVARVWRRAGAPVPAAAMERAAIKSRRRGRRRAAEPEPAAAPAATPVPVQVPRPAAAAAPPSLVEYAAQREAVPAAQLPAAQFSAPEPSVPRPAEPEPAAPGPAVPPKAWRRTTRDIAHEDDVLPFAADVERPPATPRLEVPPPGPPPGSGKRALASGVRRPGEPAEFWQAVPAGDTRPDVPQLPRADARQAAEEIANAPEPAAPSVRWVRPAEPGDGVTRQPPAEPEQAHAAEGERVRAPRAFNGEPGDKKVAGTRIRAQGTPAPQRPTPTRPDIPMVPGAFGAQNPSPAQPPRHATAHTTPPATPEQEPARPEDSSPSTQDTPRPASPTQHVTQPEDPAPQADSPAKPEQEAARSENSSPSAQDAARLAQPSASPAQHVTRPEHPAAQAESPTASEQEAARARSAQPPMPTERPAAEAESPATPEPEAARAGESSPSAQDTPRPASPVTRPERPAAQAESPAAAERAADSEGGGAESPAPHAPSGRPVLRPEQPVMWSGRPAARPEQPAARSGTEEAGAEAERGGAAGGPPVPPERRPGWSGQRPEAPAAAAEQAGAPPAPHQQVPMVRPASPPEQPGVLREPPRPWSQGLSKPQRPAVPGGLGRPDAPEPPPAEPPAVAEPPRPVEEEAPPREVRSQPASPVRPRPLPPPPAPPPSGPAITPPGPEHEVTSGGLRRLIHAVGGGHGEVDADYQQRIQQPFHGTRHVVVLGCTGGAGQTVTALMLGHTFAQHNGEPVVAIDVNPGPGALARRTRSDTNETLTGLITRADQVSSLTAMRRYTSQAKSGLDVIAAGKNPLQALDDRDYALAIRTLDKFYSVTLLDAAAAVVARVLPYADQIVLVAPASADAPRAVAMTFEWLDGHGYEELRSRAVTVINGVSRRSMDDVEQAEAVARGRCRALVRIPWDDHLSMDRAPRNELKSLRTPTRRAYLALAGVVAGGFTVMPERYQELQQEQEATR